MGPDMLAQHVGWDEVAQEVTQDQMWRFDLEETAGGISGAWPADF